MGSPRLLPIAPGGRGLIPIHPNVCEFRVREPKWSAIKVLREPLRALVALVDALPIRDEQLADFLLRISAHSYASDGFAGEFVHRRYAEKNWGARPVHATDMRLRATGE